MHRTGMAIIIPVQFRPSRLPGRLLNDGWWLETKPIRPTIVAFTARSAPEPETAPETGRKPRREHLTLAIPEK